MPEGKTRTKIITIKDTHIRSLKIKNLKPEPFIIKDLTLKDVRLIFKLPPEEEEK